MNQNHGKLKRIIPIICTISVIYLFASGVYLVFNTIDLRWTAFFHEKENFLILIIFCILLKYCKSLLEYSALMGVIFFKVLSIIYNASAFLGYNPKIYMHKYDIIASFIYTIWFIMMSIAIIKHATKKDKHEQSDKSMASRID